MRNGVPLARTIQEYRFVHDMVFMRESQWQAMMICRAGTAVAA